MTHDKERTGVERGWRPSRRTVLKTGAAAGLFSTIPWSARRVVATNGLEGDALPDDVLNNKYVDELPIPATLTGRNLTISLDETSGYKFHQNLNGMTVWGYNGSYLGPTIEARRNREINVTWQNNLGTTHLFTPVDDRVHGTRLEHYDYSESPVDAPGYIPEARVVTHVHGAHVPPESDGLPEAWYAKNGAKGPRFSGTTYTYPNQQPAATLWYHDHSLGITRLNVYAGLAGFYLLRSRQEERLGLPAGDHEVPIVIQDRSFTKTNGDDSYELFYPTEFAAEFAADYPVVNGKLWPKLTVEPRQYRLRFLNGANGRFFNLSLEGDSGNSAPGVPTMYQIGVELGFLPEVVSIGPGGDLDSLLLSPAERGDVLVDFSDYSPGDTFLLKNDAASLFVSPDESIGQTDMPEIMQIVVAGEASEGPSVDPTSLRLPARPEFPEESAVETRRMTLSSEALTAYDGSDIDTHLLNDSLWNDEEAVVKPQLNTTEVWELVNLTGDAHPIHIHLVEIQVLDRYDFDIDQYEADGASPSDDLSQYISGPAEEPAPNELGDKDTVRVHAGEMVRIIARFGNYPGRFVWHCHILEHEDQEMMLPFEVVTGQQPDEPGPPDGQP